MNKNNKIDLIKGINKLFSNKKLSKDKDIPLKDRKMYMEPSVVSGIIPKKEWVLNELINNFEVVEQIIPTFSYEISNDDFGNVMVSKYDAHYLKLLLSMCKNYDSIKISVKKDYPLMLECDDFIFILAPKVDY